MDTANISPAKLNILLILARFVILTAAQICKATRSPKAIRETYRQLQPLIDAPYVDCVPTGPPRWGGKPLGAYFLTDKGFRYLLQLEMVQPGAYRARAIRGKSQAHFTHTLESNELLILCCRLTRQLPQVVVARFATEHELKRQPVRVHLPSGVRQAVIPDGFVSFRTPREQNLVFELDRNSEWLKRPIRNRLFAYLAWERGPYARAFNTKVLTSIAWVVSQGGVHRAELLCQMTEEVLKEARAERLADLFKFAAFHPEMVEPAEVLLAPIWRQPFSSEEVPLLSAG